MDETPTTTTTVCRSCLKESGEFQSVFVVSENSGCELFLADMISSCASVQITLGDGLPEQICLECVNRTVDMYLFKLQCEKSDKILRERLTVTNKQSVKELELSVNNNNENSTINSLIGEEKIIKEDIDNFVPALDDDVKLTSETVIVTENDTESEQHNITFTNEEDKFSSTQIESYECKLCPQQFERSDLLWRHQISHAIKLTEENENDDTHNDSLEQLNDECMVIIKTEEDVIYTCQDCGFIFIRKDELDRHLEMHLPSVKIGKKDTVEAACQVCSKTFRQRGQLNRHMKTHITVKAHVCKTCGRSFARPEQLKNHMNVHLGSKPHICEICFKGFNQISNLKDHMRTHNGERPFLCSTCGKGFNQLGNLRQHTIRHSGIKAHLCSTCGSGFASKGELSAHLRKHTGARPFVCSICNHGFTTSSSLTKHKRIHSGEKPYECDVCKMKFSRSGILARHKRTHTGEKPYICKFCSKAFSQSNDLTSHLRIHTGEKPYICDVCGHAFRQSSGLKAHKKTHIDKEDVVDNNRRNKIITLFN